MCRSEGGMRTDLTVSVGEVWKSKTGKERVRVGRVWRGAFTGVLDDYVRCHPTHGGPYFVAPVSEFVERFACELVERELT
jgi:hypothetical protein